MECFSRVDSPDGSQSGSVPCATLSQNSENLSAFRQPERWPATEGGSAQALDHMRAERTDQPRSREGGRADVSELLNRCFVVAGSGQGPPQEKLVQAAPARKPIATRQVDVQLGKIGGGDHRAPPPWSDRGWAFARTCGQPFGRHTHHRLPSASSIGSRCLVWHRLRCYSDDTKWSSACWA